MKRSRLKKASSNLIGIKARQYIDLVILSCTLIVLNHLHPVDLFTSNEGEEPIIKTEMTYIFHDYYGNEYILNDSVHGAAEYRDYLFDDEIPDEIKGVHNASNDNVINLGYGEEDINDYSHGSNTDIKDNQISLEDIMINLGVEDEFDNADGGHSISLEDEAASTNDTDNYVINMEDFESINSEDDIYYNVDIKEDAEGSTLIIERISNDNNNQIDRDPNVEILGTGKTFSFIDEGWILPTLRPWNELVFSYRGNIAGEYNSNNEGDFNISSAGSNKSQGNESGIYIIKDYEECMTPWGYTIQHGESVLAYEQMSNAPDICNIERRFCREGKLSGTYTQQGCAENENYTYAQRDERPDPTPKEPSHADIIQHEDGSVTVQKDEIGSSFMFEKPNNTYSTSTGTSNIVGDKEEVEQTERVYWDCTTPWGETVKHGQFVQAFKHANGFSDAPCEAQLRLCSMGDLMGTYIESTCKTWDTSFIDRINGSPTRETYSKEKLERVKKQIKNEQVYDKDYRRLLNSDSLDQILKIMES